MGFTSQREGDGTYSIWERGFTGRREILMTGVRGCNVSRIISRLTSDQFFREISHVRSLNELGLRNDDGEHCDPLQRVSQQGTQAIHAVDLSTDNHS